MAGNKLYFFSGRNTAVVAKSAKEARKRKRRGGNKIVKVLKPNAHDRKKFRKGKWTDTRKDGKTKAKSRYGKGRGKGPSRAASRKAVRNRRKRR